MDDNTHALRLGESLLVMNGIRVTVKSLNGGQVKLSITAPFFCPVTRAQTTSTSIATVNATTRDLFIDLLQSRQNVTQWEAQFLRDLIEKKDGTKLSEKQIEAVMRVQRRVENYEQTRRRRTA